MFLGVVVGAGRNGSDLLGWLKTSRAAAFWTSCKGLIVQTGGPTRRALQYWHLHLGAVYHLQFTDVSLDCGRKPKNLVEILVENIHPPLRQDILSPAVRWWCHHLRKQGYRNISGLPLQQNLIPHCCTLLVYSKILAQLLKNRYPRLLNKSHRSRDDASCLW